MTNPATRAAYYRQRDEAAAKNALLAPQPSLSHYVFGKVMPQAVPLEEAVLGAIMLDREAMEAVSDILRPESFYTDSHKLIYRAALALHVRSEPIDLLTLTEEIRKSGDLEKVAGGYYLVELSNKVASAANIEYHARIIAQKFVQREMIRVSTETIRDAYEDTTDALSLLDTFSRQVSDIESGKSANSGGMLGDLVFQTVIDCETASQQGTGITGIRTGLRELDNLTGGLQDSDLIILAARPGMGKTSLALTIAMNASKDDGVPTAVFSLEMSKGQIVQRIAASEAAINISDLRRGKVTQADKARLSHAAEGLAHVPLHIDDTPSLTLAQARAKCRKLVKTMGLRLAIFDYIGLFGSDENDRSGNREQEVGKISRGLKALAKELGIPIILLSQLSRAVETRGGAKRPMLSDLRESGSVEQDADIVGFIYRPEYYLIMEDENGQSTAGMAEIIIAKHRNGAVDTLKVGFADVFARFHNLGDKPFPAHNLPPFNPAAGFPARRNEEENPF